MKVLFVNSLYPPIVIGGAEVSVSLLARAVAAQGIEVEVVSLHPDEGEKTETVDGVEVHRLPVDNVYWPFGVVEKPSIGSRLRWHLTDMANAAAASRFGRVLDREKPDLVHTHNLTGFSVSLWSEARKRGIPIVHTLRDYSLICKRSTLFSKGRTCERRCLPCISMTLNYKIQSSLVDTVASNSQYMLNAHKSRGYFSGKRSAVIHNIADMTDIRPRQREKDVVFGFIGRIEDEKGIEVVLEATRRLPRDGWRLRIAGRGIDDYIANLRREYDDPRIEWLGFIKPQDFYAAIDVCLVSSVWPEPLPRTLIESIANGRATICSTAGGIPEIAESSALIGTYGPRDDKRLAELMELAISEPETWCATRPPSDEVRRHFAPETIANAYISLYRETLASKGDRSVGGFDA